MSRKSTGIVLLLVALLAFLALAWRSLIDMSHLARNALGGDGTAREAISVLLEINGLPIIMLGGLMLVLLAIYWKLFVRRDEDDDAAGY
ncbi:MAG TPA: hypothetical protein VGN72_17180 [Tepidisphaeraceae bacterium]|jgi:hypothetical protein|nr:hypothetical protein [Tepidisphaeraceae bacterium]